MSRVKLFISVLIFPNIVQFVMQLIPKAGANKTFSLSPGFHVVFTPCCKGMDHETSPERGLVQVKAVLVLPVLVLSQIFGHMISNIRVNLFW